MIKKIIKDSKVNKNSHIQSKSKNFLKKPNSISEDYSESDEGLKKVVKDIGIVGISTTLLSFSGIILIPVLTKNLGPYGYGLWAQTTAIISLLMPFLSLGLPFSMTRIFAGKDIQRIRQDFYSILIFNILSAGSVSLLIFLAPDSIGNVILEGELGLAKILAIILFISSLELLFKDVFRSFREIKKYALIRLLRGYSEVILAILLVLLGYGLIGAILASLVVRAITSIILFIAIGKKLPFKKPNFLSLKEYFKFGVPVIPAMISTTIVSISDRLIIGFFLGATFVGYYAPGYSFGMLFPSLIIAGLGYVLLPTLSEYYEAENISMIKTILQLSVKYFLLLAAPYFLGTIIVGKPILELFTTSEIAREGYKILFLSAFASIFLGLYTIYKQIIYLNKKTSLISIFWGVGAAINIIGNIYLIPKYGIISAGITTILSYVVVMILVLYFSSKFIIINIKELGLVKIILCSFFMFSIIYFAREYIWSNPFFIISLGVIIYFTLLFVTGAIDKKEINFLKNLRRS